MPLPYLCAVAVLAGFGLLVNLGALYMSIFATDDSGSTTPTPFRCTTAGTLTMYAPSLAALCSVVMWGRGERKGSSS
ncbi:hypothetical protein [Streptomyces cyaneofuscatus]|uniref:hypothetical protein n=1 Tax=Streptomyces cyaneofuscatus TaxID=66883 RepID=UPI003663A67D